jgi:hypothetical protein
MPAGFASPDVLFGGNSGAPERLFYRVILEKLRGRYTRYCEVGVGSFAASMVAADAGWKPSQMESSDVTLYSSIVGTMLARGNLADLGVRLDGDLVELPDTDLLTQAAFLLWVQLRARMEARPDVEYWRNICHDLTVRARAHQEAIRGQLAKLNDRLGGVNYRPMDMWDHIPEVLDDPCAIVHAAPPSYPSGFEVFFNTDGRLTWNEPPYDVFDPATGFDRLADMMRDSPALLICLQECQPRTYALPRPVFATPIGMGRHTYVITNRPDEIFAITGGPHVVPRRMGEITPSSHPPMPVDYDLRPDAQVAMIPVKAQVADYYRDIWLHRLAATPGSYNVLVTIDGYVACVIGFSIEPISRPYPGAAHIRHLLLRYGVGAPHVTLRTGRLATMFALQKPVAELAVGTGGALYLAASRGLMTVQMTRYQESKEMRGLMRRINKQPHPDGFKLTYAADWQDKRPNEVLAEFLAIEARWRAERAKAKAAETGEG